MIENLNYNAEQAPKWQNVIAKLSDQFVEDVFEIRAVEERLREGSANELKILLGLFVATKLNNDHSQKISLEVVGYYFENIFSLGNNSRYLRRELIELVSERHEFYIAGISNRVKSEDDFLRAVGMHWFQFPLQKKDSSYVPFNYDFFRYFSDNDIVSKVMKEFAPNYADAILQEVMEDWIDDKI
ncbi:MAG: hypothetical protein OCD76_23170 [Reichenbachiella sp.]